MKRDSQSPIQSLKSSSLPTVYTKAQRERERESKQRIKQPGLRVKNYLKQNKSFDFDNGWGLKICLLSEKIETLQPWRQFQRYPEAASPLWGVKKFLTNWLFDFAITSSQPYHMRERERKRVCVVRYYNEITGFAKLSEISPRAKPHSHNQKKQKKKEYGKKGEIITFLPREGIAGSVGCHWVNLLSLSYSSSPMNCLT